MTWQSEALIWLVDAAIFGGVILAIGCVAVRCRRQPVERLRIIEWTLVGCLLAPLLHCIPGVPQWSLGWLPAANRSVDFQFPTVASLPDTNTRPMPDPRASDHAGAHQTAEQSDHRSIDTTRQSDPVPNLPPSLPFISPSFHWSWPLAIVVAFTVGVVSMAMWWIAGLFSLWLLQRSSQPVPRRTMELFRLLTGDRGSKARLNMSQQIELPVAFGLFKPAILMPQQFCDNSTEPELKYCLAHEWSHLEHGDVWRWRMTSLVGLFFFYQPLYWWLRRQVRLCQDYLADDRAAHQSTNSADYAQFLVMLAQRRLGLASVAGLSIGDGRSNLYRRVTMLLGNRPPLRHRAHLAWNLGIAAAAIVLLCVFSSIRLDADDARPASQSVAPDAPKQPESPKGNSPEILTYSGIVQDKVTGKPIEGATVTVRRSLLRNNSKKVLDETKHTTNPEGKYTFSIPPEQAAEKYLYIELDVEHSDYPSQFGFGYSFSMIRKNEQLGGRPFFEKIELRPGKEVTGIVQTADGNPAVGVKVLAYSNVQRDEKNPQFEYGSFHYGQTDDQGRFRVVMITPGEGIFWILPEKDFVPSRHVMMEKRGDQGAFVLQPGLSIKGKVVDQEGKPLAGAYVNAEFVGRHPDQFHQPVADYIGRGAVSDAEGTFEMAPLPPGEFRIAVQDHLDEPSLDRRKQPERRPVPAVFMPQKLLLTEQQSPDNVVVRAIPEVVIEGRHLNSQGKPSGGHAPHLFGKFNDEYFFTQLEIDPDGKFTAKIPKGLSEVELSPMTNEHHALRWRRGPSGPLSSALSIGLGTVNDDIKGIEIVRYDAPIVLVKAVAPDGSTPKDLEITAEYPQDKARENRRVRKRGLLSAVSFEQQEDGRFRSVGLLPDEETKITAHAEGFADASEDIKLPEGEQKELVLKLQPAEAKQPAS